MERIKDKATTILYLGFCIVVATVNTIVLHHFIMFLFSIPFVISFFTKGKISIWFETFGLIVISLILLGFESSMEGLIVALAATCTFLTRIDHHGKGTVFIFGYSIAIGILSFVTTSTTEHRSMHALLDALLYIVAAYVFRFIINQALRSLREKRDVLEARYRRIINDLQSTTQESIDELKRVVGK